MPQFAPTAFDTQMMRNALHMARRGLGTTSPNPAVGAVIADEHTGEIIARGWTQPGGRPHAEPVAIAKAGERARGKTMYVTLEPCSHYGKTPPCSDAVVAAGLQRVVVALTDPDPRVSGRGLEQLRRAGLQVLRGVCAEEAHWLTRGHIVRITERRPFVQLKMAVGADGEVPRGSGGMPVFVTGADARAHAHLLRAEADAILVGHGTVRDDDPELTCRLPGLAARSPIRIVMSSSAAALDGTKLLASARDVPVHLVTSPASAPADAGVLDRLRAAGVVVHAVRCVGGRIWLPSMLETLASVGVTRLMVEGGPGMWTAFARHGLFDEVVLFHARPHGAQCVDEHSARRALAALIGLDNLALAAHRRLADDDMLVFRQHLGHLARAGLPAAADGQR